jgi:hypothetical protein
MEEVCIEIDELPMLPGRDAVEFSAGCPHSMKSAVVCLDIHEPVAAVAASATGVASTGSAASSSPQHAEESHSSSYSTIEVMFQEGDQSHDNDPLPARAFTPMLQRSRSCGPCKSIADLHQHREVLTSTAIQVPAADVQLQRRHSDPQIQVSFSASASSAGGEPAASAASSSDFASSPPPAVVLAKPPRSFPPVQTYSHFTCRICLGEESKLTGVRSLVVEQDKTVVSLARLRGSAPAGSSGSRCNHLFCRECLVSFLVHEITEGKVLKIRCPGVTTLADKSEKSCLHTIPTDVIRSLVPAEDFERYQRYVKLKSEENWRACPRRECGYMQQKKLLDGDNMTCERCAQVYCFRHDLAHAHDLTSAGCSAYSATLLASSAHSLSLIHETTVKCPWPGCPSKIHKFAGCNHVTCPMCRTEFCYSCRGFYFYGLHYTRLNIFGCQHFSEDGPGARDQWWRTIGRWTIGPPAAVIILVSVLALFATMMLLWCLYFTLLLPLLLPYHRSTSRAYSTAISHRALKRNPASRPSKEEQEEMARAMRRYERSRWITYWGPVGVKAILWM